MRTAINEKCRDCIYDPGQPGRWREQIAACESGNCALHALRPVPRDCTVNGLIHPAKIAAVRAALAEHQAGKANRQP